MRLLFHVQHLLGIGHVRRAALIARALTEAGVEVVVASGGFPVPGTDFGSATVVQLPPARAENAHFKTILDERAEPVSPAWRDRRRDLLLDLFRETQPDILLIETYPFGRRPFRFELDPLLDTAKARPSRPLIACSVRDILVARNDPDRVRQMADRVLDAYDLVLIHGDPSLIPFEASFPLAPRITSRLRYTGYVAQPPMADDGGSDGQEEVIVSAGGGAVGGRLLETALAARGQSTLADRRWRLLTGPDLPKDEAHALQVAAAKASGSVIVEPARPDFPLLLRRCALSISQAGYNTVLDIMGAGCPAILVPFAVGRETEQPTRARLLSDRGLVSVVEETLLSPKSLANAVNQSSLFMFRPAIGFDRNGAANTARILLDERVKPVKKLDFP